MNPSRSYRAVATALAAAVIGAGAGAGAYALLSNDNSTTVVKEVTVQSAEPASSSSPLSVKDIYQRSYKGVVKITVVSGSSSSPFGSQQQEAQGSGFVYDGRGDVITNQHVVDGATSISVTFWNGATYKAHLVGSDPSTDLALVRVDAPGSVLHPLPLGDSAQLSVGDGVIAIGSPFGLSETVTSGIVSALHRQMTSPNGFAIDDSIQTDAAINHGNSGGPLLNSLGRVVGVTAQIRSDSGGNEGVGFAVPSDTVRSIVAQILETGKAVHAYLGVSLNVAAPGAHVDLVRPGTPAARAGLRGGDVITAIDGTKIGSAQSLQNAIAAHKPGDSVSVTFSRGGTSHTVRLTLTSRPA